MQAGQLFAEYCDLIGFDKTNAAVKDILGLTTEVPPEFADKMKATLMTEAQAKNNPTVKAHFTKNALDAIDQDQFAAIDEMPFDDAKKAEIKGEKSTYKRNALIRKASKEFYEGEIQKAVASGADKDRVEKLIKAAKDKDAEILNLKDSYKKEKDGILANEDARMMDYLMRVNLASRKYPGEKIPQNVHVLTAYNLLQEALRQNNAKAVFGDQNKTSIKLVQGDNPDLEYTVNNKALTYDAFVEQKLADAGMTIVSNPTKNGNGSHVNVDTSKFDNAQKELVKYYSPA